MRSIRKILVAICVCMAVLMIAPSAVPYSFGSVTAEAATVKLNKKKATLYIGETLKLKVKGTKSKVKWSSNKKSVATVDSNGKVLAKVEGNATITAKVGKKKYKCKVTVKAKKKSVPAISVNTQDITIKDSGRIYVTFNDTKAVVYDNVSNNGVIDVTWNSTYQVGNTRALDIIAKKNGVAYIALTNNITSENITIKVTVKGHVEPIEYIGDRDVEYNSTAKEHRLFFSLIIADATTRVASSGVANIKIVNADGVEIYNKQVPFTKNDFANWTDILGTKYMCCIKIPDSELIQSTTTSGKSGKLTFNIVLNDGTTFSDATYTIDNLPLFDWTSLDANEKCSIEVPEVPIELKYLGLEEKAYAKCVISDVKCNFVYDNNGKINLVVTYSGFKSYDYWGENANTSVFYMVKLYKGDKLIKSETPFIPNKVIEEDINYTSTYYDVEPGEYRLELMDYQS